MNCPSFPFLCLILTVLAWNDVARSQSPNLQVHVVADRVVLRWDGAPDLLLQRSLDLDHGSWVAMPHTLGATGADEARLSQTIFYRLVRVSDAQQRVLSLPNRVASLVANQLQRATTLSWRVGGEFEYPPDDGDAPAPRTSLFGFQENWGWASQPGLIRVFTTSQEAVQAFKLYSSPDSVVGGWADLLEDVERLREWQNAPARFVDLNEPVELAQERRYPILDPRAETLAGVEGLHLSDAAHGEALPMPVEWVYVLADGTLGFLDENDVFQGNSSEENPIVARFAYWTDDESCKVNVNTASEGLPWETPKGYMEEGRLDSLYQPVTNEVQRYTGHPAMTCLSSLLYPAKRLERNGAGSLTEAELESLYALTPRVVHGGSEAGTRTAKEPIKFDTDSLHIDEASWIRRARGSNPHATYWQGLITTASSAPEITTLGKPRISLWPVSTNEEARTAIDRRLTELVTLGSSDPLIYLRDDARFPLEEFYTGSNRHNVRLFNYLLSLVYENPPGYRRSLAQKYGASFAPPYKPRFYEDANEYLLPHFHLATLMMDYIRGINLVDGHSSEPYAGYSTAKNSFGQVRGLSLIGRELETDDGESSHESGWYLETLEPRGPGRSYTLSEVALTFFKTARVRMDAWKDDQPSFRDVEGSQSDQDLLERILGNQHPFYEQWRGHSFGPEDVGKSFALIQAALLPELFSVAQGHHFIHPDLALRLQTGGPGYQGGAHLETGLKVNGVPLTLWGSSFHRDTDPSGPEVRSIDPNQNDVRGELPDLWPAWGGPGGYRLMRFGTFEVSADEPGFSGETFLPSGSGPLSGLYCQTPIVVCEDELLVLEQSAPLQLILYELLGTRRAADISEISQVFALRFAPPGESVQVSQPKLASPRYRGWNSRRFRSAWGSTRTILDPELTESVKGLTVSHGDYRHIATKRVVPSELFRPHPLTEEALASHSLTWATRSDIVPGATFGDDLHGRQLVDGVEYEQGSRPDFTFDPNDREAFAPLLSRDYHFPIDPSITRDFDNAPGQVPDGAYINKPDDGANDPLGSSVFNQKYAYFEADLSLKKTQSYQDRHPERFNPRRMVASPVAFGSLPSAVQINAPWTCLLFRPNVSHQPHLGEAGNGVDLRGTRRSLEGFEIPQFESLHGIDGLPPDHLWLDHFWMPASAPSHVGEPFATHGKVNLNFQMFPFINIHRATALHAVLKAERILAIPTHAGRRFKRRNAWNEGWSYPIDAFETLKQFEAKFNRGELFIHESEICEQFLIPKGVRWDPKTSLEPIQDFWDAHRLTGDNTLERPYAGIYSRITTRSNSFRVHYRVQAIAKDPEVAPNQIDLTKDRITSDDRGSAVLERQIDLNHPDLPDYLEDIRRLPFLDRLERFYETKVRRWATFQ